ncbi:MAG: hypothetical protein RIM72_16080 [Alphaproteobacteria bacterium]
MMERVSWKSCEVINAAGMLTEYGASSVAKDVASEVYWGVQRCFDIEALQLHASRAISELTGSESGFVTGCSAAGVTIAAAACLTGDDDVKVRCLPNCDWDVSGIVIPAGHMVDIGVKIEQLVHLSGGRCIPVDCSSGFAERQFRAALDSGQAAATLFVRSYLCTDDANLQLDKIVSICASYGVPVIVDDAGEFDFKRDIDAGADLVVFSAQKAIGGLTAGLIAGRMDLISACKRQEHGIGRAMKVGKEGLISALAAIEKNRFGARVLQHWYEKLDLLEKLLYAESCMTTLRIADEGGRPLERLRVVVGPKKALGLLSSNVASGVRKIIFREVDFEAGSFLVDFSAMSVTDVMELAKRLIKAPN